MTEETTGVLEKELAGVNEQIVRLEQYKTALNAALLARLDLDGFISARPQVYSPQTVTLTALTEGKDSPNARPNSLEMARVVLLNLDGEEKTPDEIRALIKKTYGIGPAKTLDSLILVGIRVSWHRYQGRSPAHRSSIRCLPFYGDARGPFHEKSDPCLRAESRVGQTMPTGPFLLPRCEAHAGRWFYRAGGAEGHRHAIAAILTATQGRSETRRRYLSYDAAAG